METNIITIEQMMKDAKHITSIEIASLVGIFPDANSGGFA